MKCLVPRKNGFTYLGTAGSAFRPSMMSRLGSTVGEIHSSLMMTGRWTGRLVVDGGRVVLVVFELSAQVVVSGSLGLGLRRPVLVIRPSAPVKREKSQSNDQRLMG